jgi:hypothetical protein
MTPARSPLRKRPNMMDAAVERRKNKPAPSPAGGGAAAAPAPAVELEALVQQEVQSLSA